jgi:hypothetical protein
MAGSRALGGAPDAEAVSQEFLARFARLWGRTRDEISAVPDLRQTAGEQAQALLDRLLVLFFVQEKGLLDASRDYFSCRFLDGHADRPGSTSYYREVVHPLLLAVGERQANQALAGRVGAVPFLGGSFFARPQPLARLPVSNATFRALFDELLVAYRWTPGNDGQVGPQGGIGSQILGQVFEKLVLERGQGSRGSRRRATGSYYTPQPVVTFMVREALAETLVGASGQDREAIARLLDMPPAARLDGAGRDWLSATFPSREARELKRLLLDLRACDPAAGSGAFLVGLLQAMARAVSLLDWRLDGDATLMRRNHAYDVKRQIVERCLYGVDLQARAVEICRLTIWLALLAEYELPQDLAFVQAVQHVPSLEGLVCQVRQGDSLLGWLDGPELTAGDRAFAAWSGLAAFQEKGGFDLMIGNPPYGARVRREDWARIKAHYAGAGLARNLAAAFLVLPFDGLHAGGVACQIVPKSVSFSRGWRRTRAVLWARGCLLASADVSQATQGVLLEQEVVLYRPSGRPEERPRSWHLRGGTFVEGHRVPLRMLKHQDAILNHLSAGAARLLARLFDQCRPLGSYTRTVRGSGWQARLVPGGDPQAGAHALRGRDIRQFVIGEDLPGLLCDPAMEEDLRAMAEPKIVSQNLVAHVTRPYDTLLILSAVDRSGAAALDTVNLTTLRPGCPYPLEYLVALLNSSLARWYFTFAVYNRAVRTMHFDAPYVGRFPVAAASPHQVAWICHLVEELAARQGERETKYLLPGDDVVYDALDKAIFDLYALSPGDVDRVLRLRCCRHYNEWRK